MAINKRAEQSEKNAFSKIKMSANSGRTKRDGDFKNEDICFDNKLQSTALDWKIKRFEIDKIRADALRCGRKFGALIVENSAGRSIVAMDADEFAELLIFYGVTNEVV